MTWTLRSIVESTAFTRDFPVWARYLITTGIVLLALALRLAFSMTLREDYFLFFFPAIVLSAVLFDRGSGIWATLLSAGFVSYTLLPWQVIDTEHLLMIFIFVAIGIAIAAVIEIMHRAIEELALTVQQISDSNEQLAMSNRTNSVLLDELRHRTKNELQLIHSLLHMQARSIGSAEQAQEAITAASNRVMVVGRAHERFALRGSKTIIDLCQYIEDVCSDLRVSVLGPQSIVVMVQMQHCYIAMEKALPVGLVLNELVTNAIKYAFPQNRSGDIQVKLYRNAGDLCLAVIDDGIGPNSGNDNGKAKGTGQRLVRALISQINGRIEITGAPAGGTQCTICFPAQEEEMPMEAAG